MTDEKKIAFDDKTIIDVIEPKKIHASRMALVSSPLSLLPLFREQNLNQNQQRQKYHQTAIVMQPEVKIDYTKQAETDAVSTDWQKGEFISRQEFIDQVCGRLRDKGFSYSLRSYGEPTVRQASIVLPPLLLESYGLSEDFVKKGRIEDNEKRIANIWDNWFGIILPLPINAHSWVRSRLGDMVGKRVSMTVLDIIKKNWERFIDGIDFNHLPKGFIFDKDTIGFSEQLVAKDCSSEIRVSIEEEKSIEKEEKEEKSAEKEKRQAQQRKELIHTKLEIDSSESLQTIEIWWQRLYETHLIYCKKDQYSDLLNCFVIFLESIKKMGLTLPEDPPAKGKFKNLPVTLGRILTLVSNCREEDRQQQLDFVAELSFGSTEAILALSDTFQGPHCHFVHPNMQCEEKHYSTYGYYGTTFAALDIHYVTGLGSPQIIYQTFKRASTEEKGVPLQTPEETLTLVRQSFWRFIAHQPRRLPISFYQKQIDFIEKIHNLEMKACFYTCLASTTTGVALISGEDIVATKECWNTLYKIYEFTSKIDPTVTIEILSKINELSASPPPHLLNQIFLCIREIIEGSILSAIFKKGKVKIEQILNIFDRTNQLLKDVRFYIDKENPLLVYEGMRFFREEKSLSIGEKNPSIFSCLERLESIEMSHPDKVGISKFLIMSFDSFRLNEEEIKEIYRKLKGFCSYSSEQGEFLKEALDLLNAISDRQGLNRKSFDTIFAYMAKIVSKTKDYKHVNEKELRNQIIRVDWIFEFIEFLEQGHTPNFPVNFLRKAKNKYNKPSERSVDAAIRGVFEDKEIADGVTSLVSGYSTIKDNQAEKIKTVQLLSKIYGFYGSKKYDFVQLLEHLIYYKKSRPNDHDLSDLNNLLSKILDKKNPYLLEAVIYQQNDEEIPNLIQKLIFFYQEVHPMIQKSSQFPPEISYGPLLKVVLAAPQVDGIPSEILDEKQPKKDGPAWERKSEQKGSSIEEAAAGSHSQFFLSYFENVGKLIQSKLGISESLLQYIQQFSKKWAAETYRKATESEAKEEKIHGNFSYAEALENQIKLLKKMVAAVSEQEACLLFYHYSQSSLDPRQLVSFLQRIDEVKNEKNKESLYKLFALLTGQKSTEDGSVQDTITYESFKALLELEKTNNEKFIALIKCYEHPPYIRLQKLLDMTNAIDMVNKAGEEKKESKKEDKLSIQNQIEKVHTGLCETFFEREESNRFNLEEAKRQAVKFIGKNYLSLANIENLGREITEVRRLPIADRIVRLKSFREGIKDREKKLTPAELISLTACVGEILAGSTGSELSTTQYLTLFDQLSHVTSVTHEIVTGGGKSRLNMACVLLYIFWGKQLIFLLPTRLWHPEIFVEVAIFLKPVVFPQQLLSQLAQYLLIVITELELILALVGK